MAVVGLKAIETVYKGYRFRSRLEARWAVFFDALGVTYEYEPEGFELDGVRYLPDFWLPDSQLWVEVKGGALDATAHQKATRLATASKHPVVCVLADPLESHRVPVYYPWRTPDRAAPLYGLNWCRACHKILIGGDWLHCYYCGYEYEMAYVWPWRAAQRLARQARFEFGAQPDTDILPIPRLHGQVYRAGRMPTTMCQVVREEWGGHGTCPHGSTDPDEAEFGPVPACSTYDWRADLPLLGLAQTGPHLSNSAAEDTRHAIPRQCFAEIHRSDFVFVWLDRAESVGTLIELGFAAAHRKPTFVGFQCKHGGPTPSAWWFAAHTATTYAQAPDARSAWRLCQEWWQYQTAVV